MAIEHIQTYVLLPLPELLAPHPTLSDCKRSLPLPGLNPRYKDTPLHTSPPHIPFPHLNRITMNTVNMAPTKPVASDGNSRHTPIRIGSPPVDRSRVAVRSE
jgi:hypothetical protein